MTLPQIAIRVLFALVAGGLILLQALIGGARLVYALAAFIFIGLAGLAAIPLRKYSLVAPRSYCVATALAFALYVAARALVSPVPLLARPDFFSALTALVVYLLSALYLGGTRARFTIVLVVMLFAVVQVGVAIWQFKDQANFMLLPWIYRPDYGFKASGFFISPNHFATLLGMLGVSCLSICCWGRIGLSARAFAFYAFIVCLTGAALTGSRGGYFSIAIGLLGFTGASIFLARRFQRPHFFGLSIATSLLLTVIVAVTLRSVVQSEIYEKRLRHVHDPVGKAQLVEPAALAQHRLNPVFGTGAGTFYYFGRQFAGPALQSDPQHAHDDFLEILAEYGWVGVALAAAFLIAHAAAGVSGVRRVLQQKLKPTASTASNELALTLAAASALVIALSHSIVDFTFHLPALAQFAAFFFSILANPTVEIVGRRHWRSLPTWYALLAPGVAVVLLVGAVIRWPCELLAERARLALRDHQDTAALDLARRALARDPADADASYIAGEALHYLALQTPDPAPAHALREQAAAAFTAGLQHFPQDVRLLLKLGRTLDDLGQSGAADPIFQRALAAAPGSGIALAYAGLHRHRRGDFAQAERYYHAAQEHGETVLSSAGLTDLEHDRAVLRENEAFADLLPDPDDTAPTAPLAK